LTSQWTRDPIAKFKKEIHCDAVSFLVYKDKKQWDTWQQSSLSQVRAQDVTTVLDAIYVPMLPKDIAVFAKKQEFMYAVFERMLQMDQGTGGESLAEGLALYKMLVETQRKIPG
jgi:hypothetical protein